MWHGLCYMQEPCQTVWHRCCIVWKIKRFRALAALARILHGLRRGFGRSTAARVRTFSVEGVSALRVGLPHFVAVFLLPESVVGSITLGCSEVTTLWSNIVEAVEKEVDVFFSPERLPALSGIFPCLLLFLYVGKGAKAYKSFQF